MAKGHKGRGWSRSFSAEEYEALRAAFDGPQGPYPFDQVRAAKFRSHDGHYVVVQALTPGGGHCYADLARAGTGKPYQFQNDSLEFTDREWRGLSIPEECDWFELPEEEEKEQ